MTRAAEDMLSADAEWFALQAQVSRLLVAQHRRPAEDAPGEHELTGVVRELRRAPHAIRTPMPHARVPVRA
jgi:hypothetical protein